jgi:CBS domain-containing protein
LRVLPVVEGSKLVGVITRGDLLRATFDPESGGPLDRLLGGQDRDDTEATAVLALARHPHPDGPTPGDTPVTAVMTRQVVAVTPDDPVVLATRVMLRDRHPSLPVVTGGNRLVGIISEADILADPYAGRQAHSTVGSVMTSGAISITHTATVAQARSLLADRGLRHLPVVDGDVLVGMLSRSDLI